MSVVINDAVTEFRLTHDPETGHVRVVVEYLRRDGKRIRYTASGRWDPPNRGPQAALNLDVDPEDAVDPADRFGRTDWRYVTAGTAGSTARGSGNGPSLDHG